MNTTLDTQEWVPGASGYPGDQQADLHGDYWAEVGPDILYASRGLYWAWTILDSSSTELDGGRTATEAEARAAVADWAEADRLVAEITDDLLSEAFAVYGHTPAAVDRAERAVSATTQIRRR